MGEPKIEDCDRVLVVEGFSDLRFYAELLEHCGKLEGVFIQRFNGVTDLILQLETFLTPALLSTKSAIAVVVDCDDNPTSRIQSIQNSLSALTGRTLLEGVWENGQPRLGFKVVPDQGRAGELETLVWEAWANDPQNRDARTCIESFLQCMDSNGCRPKSPDKGLIGALLAVRNDDDPRLGPGAQKGVFDFDLPEFRTLIDFLGQL
jgi:hypothetical protein